MKIIPRNIICIGTFPEFILTNWGKKARKKRATLGFKTFIKIPHL